MKHKIDLLSHSLGILIIDKGKYTKLILDRSIRASFDTVDMMILSEKKTLIFNNLSVLIPTRRMRSDFLQSAGSSCVYNLVSLATSTSNSSTDTERALIPIYQQLPSSLIPSQSWWHDPPGNDLS